MKMGRTNRQPAQVARIDADTVWLRAMPQQHCAGCSLQGGCGQTWQRQLQQRLGQEHTAWLQVPRREVQHLPKLAAGDGVWLAVPEGVLLQGAAQLYGVPMLTVLLGTTWASQWGLSDALVAASGLGLFALSFVIMRQWRRRQDRTVEVHVWSMSNTDGLDVQPVKGL